MRKVLSFLSVFTILLVNGLDKKLQFNKDGKFKIVQLTDLHFGENDEADANNQRLIRDILDQEKPDLVVVTGDVVSGYAWDGKTRPWVAKQYDKMAQVLIEKGHYWATTAGNHDEEGDLTRAEISEVDRSYNMSLTKPNSANISHSFNYYLPIFDKDGQEISFRLWFLDTGHEDCLNQKRWGCVHPDQVEWFREQHFNIELSDPSKGKGLLFIHIPLSEYLNLYNSNPLYGYKTEPISCGAVNTGLFGALIEQKTVDWVSCGHDHNNDFWGTY